MIANTIKKGIIKMIKIPSSNNRVSSPNDIENFSILTERHKEEHKYDTYTETIINIIENELYTDNIVTFENVQYFITKTLKAKLEYEFNNGGFFKPQYTVKNDHFVW